MHYVDNISFEVRGNIVKISDIQHFDPSTILILRMSFINSVLLVTIHEDKLIINLKKKAIAMPRLSIENSEYSQKKVGARKPLKDSNNWQDILQLHEEII